MIFTTASLEGRAEGEINYDSKIFTSQTSPVGHSSEAVVIKILIMGLKKTISAPLRLCARIINVN